MFGMDSIENDLMEMKANTLYKYGKKLELAEQMHEQKSKLKARIDKILFRLENEVIFKKGWFKKKCQQELTDRVRNKSKRLERDIKKLEELKEQYLNDFKQHREFCGMSEHSFVDSFYKK